MNYYPSLSLSHVTADSVGQEHQQRTAWDGILERASLPKWENLHTSPAFAPFVPTGAQCDMQLEATWPPAANMLIGFACRPLGAEQPLAGYGCHLMTPQDEQTTHYFFFGTRNFPVDNTELTRISRDQILFAFACPHRWHV